MKKLAIMAVCCLALTSIGCAKIDPLSPDLDQRVGKLEGNQNSLENMQNALKLELGRMQNDTKLDNSNDNKVQEGWVNVQSDGILIGGFGALVVGMLLFYMWKAQKCQQAAQIIGQQVKLHNDLDLKEKIISASWNTNVEKMIYTMIK